MTFNWRDYIRIESLLSDAFDENGDVVPDYQSERWAERIDAVRQIVKATEDTLDQLSTIPDFQEMLKDGLDVAMLRAQQYQDIYGDDLPDDFRVELSINIKGRSEFTMDGNRISISAQEVASLSYKSFDGSTQPFSVQGVLIDELYHWADKNLTPNNDYRDALGVAQSVVDKALQHFPEYSDEYKSSGTIAGLNVREIIEAQNEQQIMEAFRAIQPWANSHVRDEEIEALGMRQAYEKQYNYLSNDPEYEELMMGAFFVQMFAKDTQALNEAKDEIPAVEKHNSIVGPFFGLPGRDGYNAQKAEGAIFLKPKEVAELYVQRADHVLIDPNAENVVVPDQSNDTAQPPMSPLQSP